MTAYPARPALFIDGHWLSGEGRATHAVVNPATGDVLAELSLATTADLDAALDAAARGYKLWRATGVDEKAAVLSGAARLLRERVELIATTATLEQGKPLAEAKGELAYTAALVDFYAGEVRRNYGRVLVRPAGQRSLVVHEPVGPSLALCPWNFPILNPARKLAPALAAGCSMIIKPPEEAPGSAAEVLRCFIDAGLPAPVASMVFGVPDQVSRHLIASDVIRKISFTGSVPVGKHLMALAAAGAKRTTMELGGHGPVIVWDDADFDKAVTMVSAFKWRNAGQVCVSPTRVIVHEAIADRFAAALAERAKTLQVGSGLDAATQMGPLANPRRPVAMESLIGDAVAQGGTLLAGGARVGSTGNFWAPTVLADVPLSARLMNEEPFGPVATVQRVATLDAAIAEANRLPFGLAAYLFTENARTANILSDAVESGMIGVNMMAMSAVDAPFGGVKDSGHGSEDGPEGMRAFQVVKAIHQA
ncbi:NAD-dependent succinate-semialdehyde dehydrogenase [Sandarakinorhabdus oryzae]|uniref:NAD-dependent succinate-semialdehyde dehydrogenase n=1 Tax=Sandarakinorhabdus oryzae TaxID=2675220 RepID=UPI0012E0E7D4|nr:NAD-dependent succinate-semialdehyde dehydrogenase [Sandarakinorhabdus oryzae]